ncbi:hypothetical protein HYC85_029257 [Camellia sinensis]|uniref:Uncharacterized protein n=1 Tax=Camellia sinensis TaxID=4442 RepID=A0A7J7G1I5_CAMSI|nr:hypothetical protein HYC85_029257 [Camellia sinensis]
MYTQPIKLLSKSLQLCLFTRLSPRSPTVNMWHVSSVIHIQVWSESTKLLINPSLEKCHVTGYLFHAGPASIPHLSI